MDPVLLALGIGGSVGVLAGAFALGLRHGIDWDHIAAITDITSTTTAASKPHERWLTSEPGVLLTDESDHLEGEHSHPPPVAGGSGAAAHARFRPLALPAKLLLGADQRRAIFLASLYAVGHGTIVTILGLLALLASEFLPDWIDPIMGRIVGVTLVLLAVYLFYSLYSYFRGGAEFRLRSRWMLVFAGVRNVVHWFWERANPGHRHPHVHAESSDQYGAKTAYAVGLVHGIGAETGTQVLIIATAVGAGSKAMGVAALFAFVAGLLVSNSFVTVATAAGFVSARRRQYVYVAAGAIAAVFSLALGLIFLFEAGGFLPALDPYFRWIGGPDA
jgi:high-affinity nickel-transport protein